MKIELLNNDDLEVYVNSYYFKDINIDNKEELLEKVKEVIDKINSRYRLKLSGFFKIKVYLNKLVGMFINIIKIDDNDFSNDIDYRIILYLDEVFYLEIDDYIDNDNVKYLYDNKIFIDINDIEDIYKYDIGKIIYGDEASKIYKNSKMLK